MSWVTLDDVVEILRLAMEGAPGKGAPNVASVRGAINVVAPQPVRNAEFTKVLAKALHRPALFPAPGFALRLALGEMADALLLSSQRVAPQRLQQLGYSFLHVELSKALNAVLEKH
jgi:NAD dependent epimerase/dehydratase family enzyme